MTMSSWYRVEEEVSSWFEESKGVDDDGRGDAALVADAVDLPLRRDERSVTPVMLLSCEVT